VREFLDGVISSKTGLHAFFSLNTESNISFLDHSDVIAAVTNATDSLSCHSFDVISDYLFLGW